MHDEFEGFKVLGRYHASYANNVYIIVQASEGIKTKEHYAPGKLNLIEILILSQLCVTIKKVAKHKLVGSLMAA